jgi:hypothetical protein
VKKPLQIWFIFSLQDELERKKIEKWQDKFDEAGPVSAQSDTFLVQNRSFLNIFTFHLEKTSEKREILHNWSLCMCF